MHLLAGSPLWSAGTLQRAATAALSKSMAPRNELAATCAGPEVIASTTRLIRVLSDVGRKRFCSMNWRCGTRLPDSMTAAMASNAARDSGGKVNEPHTPARDHLTSDGFLII
jgi:hypothetical protein